MQEAPRASCPFFSHAGDALALHRGWCLRFGQFGTHTQAKSRFVLAPSCCNAARNIKAHRQRKHRPARACPHLHPAVLCLWAVAFRSVLFWRAIFFFFFCIFQQFVPSLWAFRVFVVACKIQQGGSCLPSTTQLVQVVPAFSGVALVNTLFVVSLVILGSFCFATSCLLLSSNAPAFPSFTLFPSSQAPFPLSYLVQCFSVSNSKLDFVSSFSFSILNHHLFVSTLSVPTFPLNVGNWPLRMLRDQPAAIPTIHNRTKWASPP